MSRTGHHLADTPVAIVGLGALYPRSPDLGQFWSNIVRGEDCITDVPKSHWDPEDYFDPDPTAPDKTYCTRGGFIPPVPFNPIEWGMPPAVIGVTDVLQLLSLGVAKATLEDAGALDSDWYDSSRTGVVLGITGANSLTQPLATRLQTPTLRKVVEACGLDDQTVEYITETFVKAYAPWEENSFPGMLGNVVSGRIANRLDLGGMNCTVDAACASSLAAVRMAVDELVMGRADLMLTGGCDAENTILMYMCFSKTPALSRSGLIRPFDKENDGTLIGEGTGMVALKRLDDAERDGDRIYAVLRGMGSSSDGRYKSIYAPRKEGQVTALKRAYEDARMDPNEIGLIECHGTGTAVGDRTELESLSEVFGAGSVSSAPATVGSVKSQIGHTKAAAGAASLIKVALALHEKVLPPTINVSDPVDVAHGDGSPFCVGTRARPWVVEPRRPSRTAAVSSFGFGGTNWHVVLAEHGDDVSVVSQKQVGLAFWTAEDRAGLLDSMAAEPTGGTWTTAKTARAAVVGTVDEIETWRIRLSKAIRESNEESIDLPSGWFRLGTEVGPAAALFAGQGSQYVGMGATAAMRHPTLRRAFDEASLASPPADPLSWRIFPSHPFDDAERQAQEDELRRTDRAQPALAAITVGQYRYLADLGFSPVAGLGHSFGELSALWAAGSFDAATLHRLAQSRGQAMVNRPESIDDLGTMAAIGASADVLSAVVDEFDGVWICNHNGPSQTVIGGSCEAVDNFIAEAEKRGWTTRRLPVGGAFHTPFVGHAVEKFGEALQNETIGSPSFQVLSCTEKAEYGDDAESNRTVLAEQLSHPVQFEGRVRELYDSGIRLFVEFGPRAVLGGLVEQILPGADDVTVLSADAGPRGDSERSLTTLVARLAVLGYPLSDPRMDLPAITIDQTNGMTIMLDGTNYEPEDRVENFREALNSAPVSSVSSSSTSPLSPVSNANYNDVIRGIAQEHLAMHQTYLGSQLKVAERLTRIIESDSRNGRDWETAVDAMHAVADQSAAIGHSHAVASDVIRAFVGASGGDSRVPPVGSELTQSRRKRVDIPEIEPYAVQPSSGNTVADSDATHDSGDLANGINVEAPQTEISLEPAEVRRSPESSSSVSSSIDEPSHESVLDVLLEVVAEKTGYPADMVDPEMDLEADLGIDSIKRVEIMSALRERVPSSASADPETMGELRTLREISTHLAGDKIESVVSDPKVS